jgi:tetratricopeptide (TPR) repeat protein
MTAADQSCGMGYLGFILFLLLPAVVVAQDCPATADRSEESEQVLKLIRAAPDEASARLLTDDLWRIWATAPDAKAQEMLDRGMQRREAYDFEAAIAAFDELVAYCPDYAEGYNQRAFINFLREDYAPALEDLEQALDLAPKHVAAMSGQALTLMSLGRVEAGQSVLREALKLHPWLPERRMLIEPPGEEL